MFKKLLSIALSALVLLGCIGLTASAKTSTEVDRHLQYNEDGKFNIMVFADIQDCYPMRSLTKKVIRRALDTKKADVIILDGDNISGRSCPGKLLTRLAIDEFMSIFEEYGIPVAIVFGNHDAQAKGMTKEYQMSLYEKYSCFIGCAGEDLGEDKLGTYYVPVYSSKDKNEMVSNLWLIDSGAYSPTNPDDYDAPTKEQIEWYKSTSESLEAQYGHKIPSLMFQHIIVPEIWDLLTECDEGTPGSVRHKLPDGTYKYFRLPDGAKGTLGESPCPPGYYTGQLDAIDERGDVLAMVFGHDHVNAFEIERDGCDILNCAGCGFYAYRSKDAGVRIITLDENDPWNYETEMYSYFDMYDENDDVARYAFEMNNTKASFAVKITAFFKYVGALVQSIFNLSK